MTDVDLALLRQMPLPQPHAESDKDARGRVMVVAGSREVPGAAILSGTAALRAGAGKLQLATTPAIAPHLGLAMPEALVIGLEENEAGGLTDGAIERLREHIERCDAVLVGPGMADDAASRDLLGAALMEVEGVAWVIDAAALGICAERPHLLRRHAGRTVLTPHAGEMAAFLQTERADVQANPLETARRAAASVQGVVVMKGPTTSIVSPEGKAWICQQGNVGLATSGSGDVLAGIIVGLLARGATPVQAAIWGVFLHAEAGNRLARKQGPIGFLARELAAELPSLMTELARA